MMGARSFLIASEMCSGRVMMAYLSASAQPQLRSAGRCPTAYAMMACAVAAFCMRFAMISSTVTLSCSGCQQS